MKLTGKLKEQVEKAETKEEKKSLIENAGMELNDEELDQVAGGGFSNTQPQMVQLQDFMGQYNIYMNGQGT